MLKDIQKEVDDLKKTLLPLLGNERTNFLRDLKTYVYVYCEISEDNKRIPIYIGKGKGDRCFAHLNNLEDISKTKNRKITNLLLEKKLSIDILAYGLDSQTALLIESACIDLMGIDNLANLVRGHGENCKRIPLAELTNLLTEKTVEVLPEHKGVSILINKCFKPKIDRELLIELKQRKDLPGWINSICYFSTTQRNRNRFLSTFTQIFICKSISFGNF